MNEHYRGLEFRISLLALVTREGYLEEGGYELELEIEKLG